jgi:hypothetical protein
MAKFSLKWTKAIGGYRIERPVATGPVAKTIIGQVRPVNLVANSDRKVSPPYDAMKTEGLYRHLEKVRDENGALEFANKFGLLRDGNEESIDDFILHADWVRVLVKAKEERDWVPFERFLVLNREVVRLNPEFQLTTVRVNGRKTDELEFFFRPASLLSAIYIQLFEDFTTGAELRLCKRPGCGSWFKFGPGTGRRNTALYCSPRCQKAHAYTLTREHDQ